MDVGIQTTISHQGRYYRAKCGRKVSHGGVFGGWVDAWSVVGIPGDFSTLERAHDAVVIDAESRNAIDEMNTRGIL